MSESPREHPSTYFVQDRSSLEEMTRLDIQDKMLTIGMGGVLPELADPTSLRSVLDVGCGTGGWLMETARTYPTIQKLIGVDISDKNLAYARARAEQEQLDNQMQFQTMDALRALPFSDDCFDLVNQRAGMSWLRTEAWGKLLLEYQRVIRPGGIIRITESQANIAENNSPALTKIFSMTHEAFFRAGRLFTQSSDGLIGELARLMTQHGIENVQTKVHTLVYRAGTETGRFFYADAVHFFHVAIPFFQQWVNVPSDYQEICQQALQEMLQPDFLATQTLVTAWGTKPMSAK